MYHNFSILFVLSCENTHGPKCREIKLIKAGKAMVIGTVKFDWFWEWFSFTITSNRYCNIICKHLTFKGD